MEYFKKNIFKFCIFGLFAFLLILPSVSAEEVDLGYVTNKTQVLYDNPQAGAMVTLNHNTNVNKYLYNILGIVLDNVTISKDYLYQLEIHTPNAKLKNINNIYIIGGTNGTTMCQSYGLDNTDSAYPKIYFKCPGNLTSISLGLNNDSPLTLNEAITTATNFQWNYTYLRYFTEDTDIDLGPVIANQTQNTQDIINNSNQNTQEIIDNQNQLLGSECGNLWNPTLKTTSSHRGFTFTPILKNGVVDGYTINGTRTSGYQNAYVVMNSNIYIEAGTHIKVFAPSGVVAQLYDGTNVINSADITTTESKTWNSFAIFVSASSLNNVNFKVMMTKGNNTTYCTYGTYTSKLDDVSGAIGGVTDAITDDDIGSSTSDASDFITNFNTNTFGLTSIITAPLNLIQSLTSSTCADLELPLPYLNNNMKIIQCEYSLET